MTGKRELYKRKNGNKYLILYIYVGFVILLVIYKNEGKERFC